MIKLECKKSFKKNSKRALSIRKIINSYISYSFAVFLDIHRCKILEKIKIPIYLKQ